MAKTYNYYVGIDVSRDKLDLCLSGGGKVLATEVIDNKVDRTNGLFAEWRGAFEGFTEGQVLVCLESTGRYANPVLSVEGHDLWLCNPLSIKRSLGLQRGKNDKVDAERIAEYAFRYADRADLYVRPSDALHRLKALSMAREQLLKARKRLVTDLGESEKFDPPIVHEAKTIAYAATLETLEGELAKLDMGLEEAMGSDQELKAIFDILVSIPGVGKVTATAMIIATHGFTKFASGKKLACYCGVAPFEHSSGRSIRGRTRVSKLANMQLKSLLHMCARSAIRAKGEFQNYFERKVKEGKHKMSVINAIQNKMVLRMFALVRDGRIYEKNYQYGLQKP